MNKSAAAKPPPSPRHRRFRNRQDQEWFLVEQVLHTVMNSGQKFMEQEKQKKQTTRPSSVQTLTPFEQTVFSKVSYYDWGVGALYGLFSFGILAGGRIAWQRRAISPTRAHLPTRASIAAGRKQQRRPKKTDTTPQNDPVLSDTSSPLFNTLNRTLESAVTSIDSNFLQDPVLLLSAAFSLCLAVAGASANMDKCLFTEHLAQVPLQGKGQSRLSDMYLCPALLEQYGGRALSPDSRVVVITNRKTRREEVSKEKNESISWFRLGSPSTELDSDSNPTAISPVSPFSNEQELWNDPETAELENIIQLIFHCQVRKEQQQLEALPAGEGISLVPYQLTLDQC